MLYDEIVMHEKMLMTMGMMVLRWYCDGIAMVMVMMMMKNNLTDENVEIFSCFIVFWFYECFFSFRVISQCMCMYVNI